MAYGDIIQVDDQTIKLHGSSYIKVAAGNERIVGGPTVSGNRCTIIFQDKNGKRIKKVYSYPSWGLLSVGSV